MTNIQNGGYLCESADDIKYSNDVKHKNLYPVFKKELPNRMKLECRDGPEEDRIRMLTDTFVSIMSTNTRWKQGVKTNVFEWYNL